MKEIGKFLILNSKEKETMNHLLESLLKEDKSREFDSLFQPAPLGALERRFIEYLKSLGCVENAEGLWDYSGNLDMSNMRLTKFPVRFGQIKGYFYCANNKLTTLEGAPKEVGGYFNCANNKLTTLEGAPKEVGGYFYCANNKLTTLEGAPKEVGGYFNCDHNKLTTLEGAPKEVGGYFSCANNKLTTLEGAPKEVGGYFYCFLNLVSVENLKKTVQRDYLMKEMLKRIQESKDVQQ